MPQNHRRYGKSSSPRAEMIVLMAWRVTDVGSVQRAGAHGYAVTGLRSLLEKAGWRLIGVHHDAPSIVKAPLVDFSVSYTDSSGITVIHVYA
jgi:hypothetical protein